MQRSINEVKCSKEDLDMKIVKEERAMRLYESSAVKRKNGSVVYERRQNWCLLFVILIFLISGILWAARPVLEIGSYRCPLFSFWSMSCWWTLKSMKTSYMVLNKWLDKFNDHRLFNAACITSPVAAIHKRPTGSRQRPVDGAGVDWALDKEDKRWRLIYKVGNMAM